MQRTAPIHAMRNWVPLCSDEQHMGWPSSMLPHSSETSAGAIIMGIEPWKPGARRQDVRFKSIFCLWHRRIGANDSGRFVFRRLQLPESSASPPKPPPHRGSLPLAVMSSAVLEVLDTSVVNVSLPHIAGSLSSSVEEATWVLTSYIVANAIILPITGWLANYMGRKRLLMTVVTGFTVSSILCGLAPNLPMLIFFRVLQGTTGGGLQPLSQAVLLEEFPGRERGKAMAFWGMGIVAAPILGPTIGGWITDSYSWRWVFYINVPVGILSLILIYLFVHDPHYIRRGTLRADLWGLGMLALGMGALQIMLDKGQEKDWFGSEMIRVLAVMAVVFLAAFMVRELAVKDPIVHF